MKQATPVPTHLFNFFGFKAEIPVPFKGYVQIGFHTPSNSPHPCAVVEHLTSLQRIGDYYTGENYYVELLIETKFSEDGTPLIKCAKDSKTTRMSYSDYASFLRTQAFKLNDYLTQHVSVEGFHVDTIRSLRLIMSMYPRADMRSQLNGSIDMLRSLVEHHTVFGYMVDSLYCEGFDEVYAHVYPEDPERKDSDAYAKVSTIMGVLGCRVYMDNKTALWQQPEYMATKDEIRSKSLQELTMILDNVRTMRAHAQRRHKVFLTYREQLAKICQTSALGDEWSPGFDLALPNFNGNAS